MGTRTGAPSIRTSSATSTARSSPRVSGPSTPPARDAASCRNPTTPSTRRRTNERKIKTKYIRKAVKECKHVKSKQTKLSRSVEWSRVESSRIDQTETSRRIKLYSNFFKCIDEK